MKAQLSADGRSLIIRIPYGFRRTGGRKTIIAPEGSDSALPPPARTDDALIRALAKARRWQTLMESGEVATNRQEGKPIGTRQLRARRGPARDGRSHHRDLTAREWMDNSCPARTLRLNALAPEIVEAILRGGERRPTPSAWRACGAAFPWSGRSNGGGGSYIEPARS